MYGEALKREGWLGSKNSAIVSLGTTTNRYHYLHVPTTEMLATAEHQSPIPRLVLREHPFLVRGSFTRC